MKRLVPVLAMTAAAALGAELTFIAFKLEVLFW